MRQRSRPLLVLVILIARLLSHRVAAAVGVTDLGTFASAGSGAGQLAGPNGIASANDGTIYVADTYNARVQIFSPAGVSLGSFGTPGYLHGQFLFPYGVDVNSAGEVFVSDLNRRDVQVFSATGTFLRSLDSGVFSQPFGLWVSDDGFVFVADRPVGVVRKFTSAGLYLGSFGSGLGSSSLVNPQNVEGDGSGTLYVSDGSGAARIEAFTESGTLIDSFGDWIVNPTGAALASGLMYLTDYGSGNVELVSLPTRTLVDVLGDNESYSFNVPFDAATVGDSLLYILEAGGGRIHRFRLDVTVGSPPSVHVLSPNGGEVFSVGDVLPITWTARNGAGVASLLVQLSRDGGLNYSVLASLTGNTGTYSWPSGGAPSNRCRIRIRVQDAVGDTAADISDNDFTLRQAPPGSSLVLSPAGGFGSGGTQDGFFAGPDGIAVSPDGYVWVADTYNSRVQKFSLSGVHLLTLGGRGIGPGQFSRPYGIDIDASGSVYVGDLDRATVQKFDSSGNLLATIGSGVLVQPFGLCVGDGVLYVTDRPVHVVRRFTTAGVPLADIGPDIGSHALLEPQNIELGGDGRLYVSDGVGQVRVLSSAGAWLGEFGSPWMGNPTGAAFLAGHFLLTEYNLNRVSDVDVPTLSQVNILGNNEPYSLYSPLDVAASGDSLLFVLDTGNNRILRLRVQPAFCPVVTVIAPNGGEQFSVGSDINLYWSTTFPEHVASIDLQISRDAGASYQAIAVGLANTGSYVWTSIPTASNQCRLRVIAHNDFGGTTEDVSDNVWRLVPPPAPPVLIALAGTFGTLGHLDGQLAGPNGIATSDDGFVYVADTYNSRVQKFTSTGVFVATLGTPGSGPGEFQRPYGIDVDSHGDVYVSDFGTRMVQKFAPDGTCLGRIGTTVSFLEPLGLWVGDTGILYVTDRAADIVRLFRTDTGEPVAAWGPSFGGVTMSAPQNIEGDGLGRFYISDGHAAFQVRVLDGSGHHIESFGAQWIGNPTGAALAGSRMFLTEYNLNRFSIVDLGTTSQIDIWGDAGDPVSFLSPIDAATLGDSLLYVLDTGNDRVVIFRLPKLTPPHVDVLYPDGGEEFFVGEVRPLRWNATDDNAVVSVDVLLSRDGGLSYSVLATRLPNSGNYSWTVSPPISSQCLVRVVGRDSDGGEGSDVSNLMFAIAAGPTPTMVVQLSAEPRPDGMVVRWQFADPALQAGSWLERADGQAQSFSRLTVDRSEDANGVVALDHTVVAGRSYWYRVVAQSGTHQWSAGPVEATAYEWITEFALSVPRPNPSADRTSLRFSLPRESSIRLTLLDVQGRVLAAPIHERRPAGRYDLLLDLRDGGARLAPGLYFVRLQVEGGPSLAQRLVVQR